VIAFLLILSGIVWVSLQARPSRAYIWSARFQRWTLWLTPIARTVRADVQAVRFDVRSWRFQRKLNRRWHL